MKRILALTLALSMIFTFAACDDELTKARAIEDSIDELEDIDNLRCEASVIIDLVEDGESWYSVLNTNADVSIEDNIFRADISVDSTNEQMEFEMYAKTGDDPVYYVDMNGTWLKMTEGISAVMSETEVAGTDTLSDFKYYYELIADRKECILKQTVIDGETYYELASPVTLTDLELVERFGLDTVVSQFTGGDASQLQQVLSVMGDVPLCIYLYEDNFLPYGAMLDLTSAMQNLYSAMDLNVTVNDISSLAIYTDYDQVEEITVPEDATKNALDLSAASSASVSADPDANPEILAHLRESGAAMINNFDSSLSESTGRTCTSTIRVTSDGFILDCKISGIANVPADVKAQLQESYNSAIAGFTQMFKPLKDAIPELNRVTVNLCDQTGEILVTIDVPLD